MTDIDRLTAALKAADQAGNTEDATKLAAALKDAYATQAPRNVAADIGSGVNKVVMGIEPVGYMVDLMQQNAPFNRELLKRVGINLEPSPLSTQNLTQAASQLGLVNAPGMPESRAEKFGKVVATAVPGVGVVGGLARAGMEASPIVQSFLQSPKAFFAKEVVAGAGAAAGGEIGHQTGIAQGAETPNQEMMRRMGVNLESSAKNAADVGELFGQLIGGFTAPAALDLAQKYSITANLFRTGKSIAQSFTETGAKGRAATLLQSNIPNARGVSQAAADSGVLPETMGYLSTGTAAGSDRLIALEKAVMQKNPELADLMVQNQAAANQTVRDAMRTSGNMDNTTQLFEAEKLRVQAALNARLAGATAKIDEAVAKLKPDATRADTSRVVSDTLENALGDARTQEKDLWNNLDGTQQVPVNNAQSVFKDLVTEETAVPGFVRKTLQPIETEAGNTENTIMNFKDLREFRTKVLRAQRAYRASNNAEGAWILQQINEGILKDIENANLGPDFANATSFSRLLNDRFTRGPVGELLRFSSRGGRAIPPELVSESILSQTPAKAATSVRAVRAAEQFPREQGGPAAPNQDLENALVDNLKTKLFKGTGEFDSSAAKQFIENKGELLNEFPQLRQQITDAVNSEQGATVLAKRIAQANVGLMDKRKSAMALILNAKPDSSEVGSNTMRALINDPKRFQRLSQAVRKVKGDVSAWAGLQDAYMRELERSGTAGSEPMLVGSKMRDYWNSTRNDVARSGLFNPEQLARIEQIVQTAQKLDRFNNVRAADSGVLTHGLSMLEEALTRFAGAKLGSVIGKEIGGQTLVTAGVTSNLLKRFVSLTPQNRLIYILSEGVRDKQVMSDLLTRPTNINQAREQIKRLNAWLAAIDPRALVPADTSQSPPGSPTPPPP